MPSTTTYERGEVVVVNVPFSNHSGFKPRPALVVSDPSFHGGLPDLIVCPISSQPRYFRRPGRGDQPLRNWRVAGLRRPSTVRVSKLLAVDKELIKRSLATLAREEMSRIDATLRAALRLP